MRKYDYLAKILDLCTDSQKNMFNRMYPGGRPTINQVDTAILQVENTLRNSCATKEDLLQFKKVAAAEKKELGATLKKLTFKVDNLKTELAQAEAVITRLQTSISIKNKDIQEKLKLLSALERAGVDNWEGYDIAIDIYNDLCR